MVIPFNAHLPFQQFCLCSLNHIIVIFLKFRSTEARLSTKQLWTFTVAGPVWNGSDEGMANEDMMKHDSNIDDPTTLYHCLPCVATTTPFLHTPLQLSMCYPTPLEPYFKLH